VDFLRVYQIMRDCGFKGPYSIEIEGMATNPTCLGPLSPARRREREVLRSLGYFDG